MRLKRWNASRYRWAIDALDALPGLDILQRGMRMIMGIIAVIPDHFGARPAVIIGGYLARAHTGGDHTTGR